ncbi:MAG TPA: tetratricopeptide repeat protein [Thermoanaerobaculia bacterium]|nr:tetratricopeptide repeat protein [Thermoanaerobaculia bacterium]
MKPKPPKPKTARREAPPPPRKSSLLVWIVVPLLALALLAQTDRLRDRLTAGRMLRQVEMISLAAMARGQVPRGLFPANLELLRRASALDPAEVGIPVARGTQYLLLGNGASAASAYREALKMEPRPEIYLNLGRALATAGETEEARRNFRLALQLDPRLESEVPPDMR